MAKPKIDLLLKEINEVKNRENDYLAHIRAFYPEKFISDNDEGSEDFARKFSDSLNIEVIKKEPTKVTKSAKNHLNIPVYNQSSDKFLQNISNSSSHKHKGFQTSNKKGIMYQFYTTRGKMVKDQSNDHSLVI